MAVEAASSAIENASIDKETLDYIIVAHNFGDVPAGNVQSDFVPSLASRVKQMLEISSPHCIAYDLPFGCPGWLQGMIQANYYLKSGDAKRALVIGAETLSRVCDPHDRDSMIYADGAGAVVLEAREHSDQAGILAHSARTDTNERTYYLRMGTSFNPDLDDTLYIKMDGHRVYQYALKYVPTVVQKSLDKAELTIDDISKVFIHQANKKMDQAILKRIFKLYDSPARAEEIMPMTISWLGNTSVATIPTLLDLTHRHNMESHTIESGDCVVFASVGAGMNINSLVYKIP